jgi:tetratricopeptide (TPR) repeat protein
VKKLYDQREVSRLTGISESQIRYWDRQGLITHREKDRGRLWFDFQSLVAFRTVRDLRRQGVSLRRIRHCVEKLRQIMPGLKQPLSEVRISLVADQLILGKNCRRFTPEGQLCIDFTGGESASVTPASEVSEELFFQALEDEDAGRLPEAREKYEKLLAAVPDHVDALVNLGTILFLAGHETAAASRYLQALAINPDHAEANYNLANLMEGQGELDAAVLFYKKAIQADPEFADAHFNLAMVLEALGNDRAGITGGAIWNWTRRASGRFIRLRLKSLEDRRATLPAGAPHPKTNQAAFLEDSGEDQKFFSLWHMLPEPKSP